MNTETFTKRYCPIILKMQDDKKIYKIKALTAGVRRTTSTTSMTGAESTTEWLQKTRLRETVEPDTDIETAVTIQSRQSAASC